jgi:hypothetical protein
MLAVFDVNPAATNWRLRVYVDPISGPSCRVEIALYDSETATAFATKTDAKNGISSVIATVARSAINFRSGPGTVYVRMG